jgi:hypothetical protein
MQDLIGQGRVVRILLIQNPCGIARRKKGQANKAEYI